MKKLVKAGLLMAAVLAISACGKTEEEEVVTPVVEAVATAQPEETPDTGEEVESTEQVVDTTKDDAEAVTEESAENTASIDPADYAGYYNNDGDDVMEIWQDDDGTYKIMVFLYRLWGTDEAIVTAEGDKLVFDTEDGNGDPMKCAVYPENGGLTFEVLDANWTYLKTGDKRTGFTLADLSEPLLNGAGQYSAALTVGESSDKDGSASVQSYSFDGQTMTITASFWFYPELDDAGTLSDMQLDIETTTEELPLDNAYFYTTGGDAGEERFDSFEQFKSYLDEVKNSGLELVILIHDNKVESVGISS